MKKRQTHFIYLFFFVGILLHSNSPLIYPFSTSVFGNKMLSTLCEQLLILIYTNKSKTSYGL